MTGAPPPLPLLPMSAFASARRDHRGASRVAWATDRPSRTRVKAGRQIQRLSLSVTHHPRQLANSASGLPVTHRAVLLMIPKSNARRSPTPAKSRSAARQQAQQSNSFLSPKCEVRRVDQKGGYAVYAAQTIRKGELLVVWSGTLVDSETLGRLPANFRRHSLQVEENQFMVSLTDCEPADYVNHSCNPNSGLRGQIALVAMRDIEPMEEITYDYAMSDGSGYDEFECKCGAPQCRNWVGSMDWQIRELRIKYEGYFSPYLAHRIANLDADDESDAVSIRNTAFQDMPRLVST
jgi:uncharacterized protein